MTDKAFLNDAFHVIMKKMVATGQAPFYAELAKELGLSTEEGRQTMRSLFSSGRKNMYATGRTMLRTLKRGLHPFRIC
jgi:hypothetical protein